MDDNLLNNINSVKDYIRSDLMLGNKIVLNDDVSVIPVYKVKVSNILLESDSNSKLNGSSISINLTPICFFEVKKTGIKVLGLNQSFDFTEVMDKAPSFINNISSLFDLDDILNKKKPC